MNKVDITHREIYDRLLAVESKVDKLDKSTADVVTAFGAAQGAFTVLEWLGKIAKPVIFIGSLFVAIGIGWQSYKDHLK